MTDKPDYSDVEMRRSKRSHRRMSVGRRTAYAIGRPLLRALLFALTSTYRFDRTVGGDLVDRLDKGRDLVFVDRVLLVRN